MLKDCLVNYLVKDNGRIPGFTESIWIMFLTLGYDFAVKLWLTWLNLVSSIIFASIHQTYALHSNIEVLLLIESSQICCRHLGCLRDGCSERILARVTQGAVQHPANQENSFCVEGLVCLMRLTGVMSFSVRNIFSPFFRHKF